MLCLETNNALPVEAEMILSAMETTVIADRDRRSNRRTIVRVQAILRLFIDTPGHAPRVLFTRDLETRSLGFITKERLPLGYGGVVDLIANDGSIVSVACTLLRCRPTLTGWYEGVLHFNRDQVGISEMIAK